MERSMQELEKEPATLMVLQAGVDGGRSMGQRYWLIRDTCIPVYYGQNLVGNHEELEDVLLGFFYESGEEIWFLSMLEDAEPVRMQVGTELTCYDIHFRMMFTRKTEEFGRKRAVRPYRRF